MKNEAIEKIQTRFSYCLFPSSLHIYWTRRRSSNLLDVTINATVVSKILELPYWLNELSPKRRVSINTKSLRIVNIRYFPQKCVSIFHKVWVAEKKMKSCVDIRATAAEWINDIPKFSEFMITQITETYSKPCHKLESLWIVRAGNFIL